MNDRPELRRSLIGRVGEVASLTRAVSASRSGRPLLVLVEGPAGIGKTALVEHVLRRHRADTGRTPTRVLRGAGVPWEADLPLGIAEQLVRALGTDPGLPDPRSPQAVLETSRLFLRQWAARQEREPVIVVVDDAHWADVESLRAIRSAVRRMSDEKVLVVLVARDEPYELCDMRPAHAGLPLPLPVLRTLEFLDGCQDHVVRLGPLTPQDVRTLAHEDHGLALNLSVARHLCRQTRGSPRYVAQLLRELPADTWQDWRPELPAPARYAAAVRHRLAQCGESARRLVEACSVLGDDTSLAEAAELAELTGVDDPLPAVDEARAAGLLTATIEPGRTQLTFAHPLVRAAVRTGLDLTRRAALHRRAAEITQDRGRQLTHRVAATTAADETLADELDRYAAERASAGEWSAVADTLVRAGRLTAARAAREDRLLRAVDAMIGAGDVPQAAAFAAELESFPASTLRDVVLGYLAIMRGRPAEAETFLADAWERRDPTHQPELLARICQRRVLHALGRWDGRDLVAWARRAIELADPDDPSAIESEAVLGLGLAAMGHSDEALAAYEAAAAKLPGGAQPQRVQLGRGWVDLALDAPEAARRRLEAAVPTGYRMGSTRISLWAQGWLARTQFALGAWPDALETVQRAAARLAEVRIELVRPLVHWTGAQIHALRGDWEAADQHVGEAAADFHHYEVMLVPSCLARAQVAEARGDYDRVVEALSPLAQLTARESVDEPGFWPWPDVYANALVLTGRLDDADAFLTPHEDLAARRGRRSAQARLGLARGRLTAARGDIDTARKEFEQALAHLEHLPLPYDRARVNFAYGQTLRRAGKRREADTILKNARDAYATLGAHTYVARCERELQAGGLHGTRLVPGMAKLTPQEQAVARLVASGATNQQTALELFISVKTVQYHLTHVYSKLGIRSRSELAVSFRELPPPE
ncbi:LuxR family transcriptional regulator [Streptomyces sp. NBC_00878]|uniref:helix-turn-helix transcriptional regulator n=1 Tax=Streptomyces sp. NBC_00878 TaxID=2975854 RepID=UPI00225070D6|nr:LuxR family transcriptional regulator [Streptomyces sp. NBC_00878]MCX4903952.1 AAA family ATPase [Streptomyces sp. NBC_00878]